MSRNTEADHKRLIETVVWFANARLTSTAQVERRFGKGLGNPVGTIGADQVDAYRNDQRRCRDMLARAIAFDRMSTGERQTFTQDVINNVANKVYLRPVASYGRSRFRLEWETIVAGVEAAIAYAVAILISSPREKLRRRVGICAYEECGKFFFDTRERGGTEMAYCSRAHSDIDRVRRHRRLKKAKGKAR